MARRKPTLWKSELVRWEWGRNPIQGVKLQALRGTPPTSCLLACLFVWSCARLLVCSLARLLVCSFARLIACLLARLFACLLSFALLAFFLACLLGSSKFVPWRLLDSSSRCSGARDSVLGGCLRAPRGVRELETRSLEAAGELLGVFGSSKFGPWSLLESSWRCSGAPHDRLGGFRRARGRKGVADQKRA